MNPAEGIAFLDSGVDGPKPDRTVLPDLQYHFLPFTWNEDLSLKTNVHQHNYADPHKHFPLYGFIMGATLLNPKSRGYITLRSADPFDYPKVFANYLSDKEGHDRKVLVEGIKIARKICQQKVWKDRLTGNIIHKTVPFSPESDEYFNELVTTASITLYHPTSTCKMGSISDKTTVVDNKLKIHGLNKIRVIDCSVFATVPNCNTNAPVIALAERASDLIKAEYSKQ